MYLMFGSKLHQCFTFERVRMNFFTHQITILFHQLHVMIFLRFLRFQLILLLNPFYATTSSISSVFQSSPSLFHLDDIFSTQAPHLERPIQVTYTDCNQIIITDVNNWAGREGRQIAVIHHFSFIPTTIMTGHGESKIYRY
uniref:Uncharacterized protein n=1 Tax=Cacopsylla melanoneura TaxID=428564 RepID=A0A8D8QHA1_9HEMI